ncbi:MAG: helix-turn-helix transcriptional regulator [Okeania sp. SIO3C4]|nr:helix-turn-helix transcriptional regulator [Okeania sp. SIO3C4]
MDLAHKLLLDTNKAIVEIAYECGYGQSAHFITAFKRKYGITPKEFRRRA